MQFQESLYSFPEAKEFQEQYLKQCQGQITEHEIEKTWLVLQGWLAGKRGISRPIWVEMALAVDEAYIEYIEKGGVAMKKLALASSPLRLKVITNALDTIARKDPEASACSDFFIIAAQNDNQPTSSPLSSSSSPTKASSSDC